MSNGYSMSDTKQNKDNAQAAEGDSVQTVVSSFSASELAAIKKAAKSYTRRYKANKDGWKLPRYYLFIPPPLPQPLPTKWRKEAKERGWL